MKLSIKETCIKLNKTERTIYKWLKVGKLQGKKIDGKWQIFIHATEKEKELKQTAPIANKVLQKLDDLSAKIEEMQKQIEKKDRENQELRNKVERMEEKISKSEVEGNKQKKREFEVLSRIVKNQLELKQKNEESSRKNFFLQSAVKKVLAEVREFKHVRVVEKAVEKPILETSVSNFDGGIGYNAPQKNFGAKIATKTEIKSQEKAEKWVRNNIAEWFTKPCGFGQLAKYSFEEIALNNTPKANINGKEQPSRAYLHVIAKKEQTWKKFKAIVALEITENKKEMYSKAYNHYAHSYEVGG